jgi:two-component system, NarL family, nitrate/nitrite response regulator NarL
MIHIAIVDDHRLFSQGLSSLLETFDEFTITGLFNDGKSFLEKLAGSGTQIVLLDIDMPGINGFETARSAREIEPGLKIILLSMHNDYGTIAEGLKLGIHGFLLKNVGKEELKLAIETVVGGNDYFTDEIKNVLVRGHRSPHLHSPVTLTPREQDILRLIAGEYSSHEIAEKLFISANTVETHRKNLLVKTGCKNSVGLVKFAMENKLI